MNEANQRLIEVVKEKKFLRQIARELKKSQIEAHKRIMRVSNRGYKFNQTFYDTGEIEYKLANNYAKNLYRTANIKLSENKDTIKFIAEADMHHGHKRSSMIYKNVLYEYCKNNDIHLIFDSGDIIDGIADRHSQSITDPEEQIISLIENHPYDKNIVNLITFGNHEFNVKNMNSLDIARVVMNERPDLVPVGYGIGIINILNDQLFLKHAIEGQEYKEIFNHLILSGHSHRFGYNFQANKLDVSVPTLSKNVHLGLKKPGATEVILHFDDNGKIAKADFCNLLIYGNAVHPEFRTSIELPFRGDEIKEEDLNINYYKPFKKKNRFKNHKI